MNTTIQSHRFNPMFGYNLLDSNKVDSTSRPNRSNNYSNLVKKLGRGDETDTIKVNFSKNFPKPESLEELRRAHVINPQDLNVATKYRDALQAALDALNSEIKAQAKALSKAIMSKKLPKT